MSLREKLFTNTMLRVILRGGDVITNYPARQGGFTPYFSFQIGKYQDDFYLYFPKEPIAQLYYNEIFNKMVCYFGNDAVQYVKFHFDQYPDKKAFLDFLFYELKHRNNYAKSQNFFLYRASARKCSSIYECAMDWVLKQQEEQKAESKLAIYSTFLRNDLKVIINNNFSESNGAGISSNDTSRMMQHLYEKVDGVLEEMESKTAGLLSKMSEDYVTSNIVDTHPQSLALFIIIMLSLKDFRIGNSLLLDHFTETDIGKILKLHFQYFKAKPKELSTITKKHIGPIKEMYYSDSFDESRKQIDKLINNIFKKISIQ
jgi:hypothetical protein